MSTFPHCAALVSLGSKTRNVFPDTKGKCFCWHERQMFLQPWKEEEKKTCTRQIVYGKRKREICKKGKNSQTSASYRGPKIRPWEPVCSNNVGSNFMANFALYFFRVWGEESGEYFSELTEGTWILPATVRNSRKPAKQNSDWGEPMTSQGINLHNIFGICF